MVDGREPDASEMGYYSSLSSTSRMMGLESEAPSMTPRLPHFHDHGGGGDSFRLFHPLCTAATGRCDDDQETSAHQRGNLVR